MRTVPPHPRVFASAVLWIACGAVLLGSSGSLLAQAQPGDDPAAWLRILDERIDRPRDLTAISFRFHPVVPAPDSEEGKQPAPFQVRYHWREGVGDRIEFLDLEGQVITEFHGDESGDGLRQATASFLGRARGYLRRINPPTFTQEFAPYRAQVLRRKLKERDVVTLRFDHKKPTRVSTVNLELGRNGLPWRRTRTFVNGDRVEGLETWEKRGDKVVLTKLHLTQQPAGGTRRGQSFSFIFSYSLVKGRRLLSAVEALGKNLPLQLKGKTEFRDLAINEDVPEFKPTPQPK